MTTSACRGCPASEASQTSAVTNRTEVAPSVRIGKLDSSAASSSLTSEIARVSASAEKGAPAPAVRRARSASSFGTHRPATRTDRMVKPISSVISPQPTRDCAAA